MTPSLTLEWHSSAIDPQVLAATAVPRLGPSCSATHLPFQAWSWENPLSAKTVAWPSAQGLSAFLLLALEKYGTKNLAEVLQPAIELAQGIPLEAHYASAKKLVYAIPPSPSLPATSR